MNKIAIVGHPASGFREVESLLHQCGMQPALASRREGLLPQDISATLCKAHGAPAIDQVTSEDQVEQISVAAVWQGMALDLMLGNLDQPLWGWADPQTVFLLDYWESLDPKLTFVLVYDEPHRALMEVPRRNDEAQPVHALQQVLDNWVAYNAALLRFYLRHPGRCLLVHSQQVRRAVDSYLQQLQPLLDTPLSRQALSLNQDLAALDGPAQAASARAPVPSTWAGAMVLANIEVSNATQLMDTTAAERYMVDGVLSGHPTALQLYAELQSVANLPLDTACSPAPDAFTAWEAFSRQRTFIEDFLIRVQAEYRRTTDELEQARGKLDELAQAVSQRDVQLDKRIGEEQALVVQLHRVQEELERLHDLKQQEVAGLTAELGAARGKLSELTQAVARREEEAAELTGKLKADQAARAAADAETANRLEMQTANLREQNRQLLLQLHQVQEELESYYLENQRLKQQIPPPLPPGHYGAAARVKQQLSYRLGAVMIQRSRSLRGWLGMPWALAAEARAFRQERAQRAVGKLPPIHTYRDAHEAERVKQHLSYRLGSALLQHGKSPLGWIRLPFVLSREVKQFRRQRQTPEV